MGKTITIQLTDQEYNDLLKMYEEIKKLNFMGNISTFDQFIHELIITSTKTMKPDSMANMDINDMLEQMKTAMDNPEIQKIFNSFGAKTDKQKPETKKEEVKAISDKEEYKN